MEGGLDAVGREVGEERGAGGEVAHAQPVEVGRVLGAGWQVRLLDAVARGPRRQLGVVAGPDPVAGALDRGRGLELGHQHRGQEVARQVARAELDPGVLVDLAAEEAGPVGALLAHDLGALGERRIVHHQRAALAARQVLGVVEALGRQAAEAAQGPPLPGAEQAVGVVLDQRGARRGGDHGLGVDGDPGVVDRHHRPRPRRDPAGDVGGIEVQGARVDVGEDHAGAAEGEGAGRRDERERRDDHLVARPQVEEQRAHLEGVGARGREQDLAAAEPRREQLGGLPGEGAVAAPVPAGQRLRHPRRLLPGAVRARERDERRGHGAAPAGGSPAAVGVGVGATAPPATSRTT